MRANKSPSHNSISLQSSTNPNTSVFDSSTLIVTNNKPGKIIGEITSQITRVIKLLLP